MLRGLICFLAGCALTLPALARTAPPIALIRTSNGEQPVSVRSLRVHTLLQGQMATTTIDLELFNPNGRVLEGQLSFPLAPGQEIDGFSLDVGGKLREAVPVEKSRGKQVFEAIERRGVDPALLEQSAANQFRLRVYPLPVRGSRQVQLRLVQSLTAGDQRSLWTQPLEWGPVQQFRLQVEADAATGQPTGQVLGQELKFALQGGRWTASIDAGMAQLRGKAEVSRPLARTAASWVGTHRSRDYFAAQLPLPAAPLRPLPSQLVLLWDSSSSGARRDHAAELKLIDAWLHKARSAKVRLIRLRDQAEAPIDFQVRAGDWNALRRELEKTVYDGATTAAGWVPVNGAADYLLFSDGHFNWGDERLPSLMAGQRLYSAASGAGADTERLAALARRTGGQLLDLERSTTDEAVRTLLGTSPRVTVVSHEGLDAIEFDPAAPPGWLRVAGQMLRPTGRLEVDVDMGDGSPHRMAVAVAPAGPASPMVPRLWARYRMAALAGERSQHRARMLDLGMQFGLPCSETSLIVLERAEDYVEHGIEPPPELQSQVKTLRAARRQRDIEARHSHLDQVLADFAEKVRWWEQEFPRVAKRTKQNYVADDAPMNEASAVVASVSGAAPMMEAAAPAPAPQARAARREAGAPAMKSAAPGAADSGPELGIALKRWTPNEPYLRRLKLEKPADLYQAYLKERAAYTQSPAFYLDVADLMFDHKQTALALRVLSNLAEMELDNVQALRLLAYRLRQHGQDRLALPLLQSVKRLAPHEPQSWRDLGLALAAVGRDQEAVNELAEVVNRPWDGRFAEVELIALAELNAIVARSGRRLDTSRVDARLLRNLPLDLRAVLSWDANDTDIDLWVTDPNGERCFYGHTRTAQGGRLSRDFTGGYGPEEFSLKRAQPGVYRVEVNYFGNHQALLSGSTSLQLTLTTGFGTPRARTQTVSLRLREASETVFVGEFTVGRD